MLNDTICGYPVNELVIFGYACRKAGITNDQLHEFITNCENAYGYVTSTVYESVSKQIEEMILNGSD